MLSITVPIGDELWDEEKEEFTHEGFVLELEHSLVTLSKWEEKYKKPFLGEKELSTEEMEGYLKIMIQTPDYPPNIIYMLSKQNVEDIQNYIQSDASATTFRPDQFDKADSKIITNELIYFWMNSLSIPKDHETWHLNRLFTLIKVHSVMNSPEKKRSHAEIVAERKAENRRRMAELGTEG